MKIRVLIEAIIFKLPWVKRSFTVDNNFLFKYGNLPDKKKNKFIKLINSGKLNFYFTDVLFSEILHLVDHDANRLKFHSEIINKMSFKAILNNFIQLIAGEIGSITFVECYPKTVEDDIKRLFAELESSGCPSSQRRVKIQKYLQENQNYESTWKNDTEANITNVRAAIKCERTRSKDFIQYFKDFLNGGFKHYYKFKKGESVKHTINFLKTNGVTVSRAEVVDTLDNKKCVYLTVWLRCKFALHYKYIRDHHNQVDVNDLRDIRYLYYLPNIDYLISDDKRVSQIGQMVYMKNKVLSFDDFFVII
jgi:hypothetical protein